MNTYTKYKPSGIEWIGDIPEHWEMRKVSRSFNLISSGTTPKADSEEYYSNGTINWINTGDLNDGILFLTEKKVSEKALQNHSGLKVFPSGTLLIAMYGATIGKTSILGIEGCTNQACCALSDSIFFEIKFVFYWFNANKSNIINLSYGGSQQNISQEIIRFLKVQSPPIEEQKKIISFLDNKTSLIDEAISKKQQLIELLKEERTALINHAVTKGISPNVKLKPSGIEWLGDIPEHWEVKKLKYVAIIKYGLGQPPKQKIGGLPLIRATNVERGKIVEKDLLFVDPEDIPFARDPVLKENDIIVVRSGAYTADSAIIPKKFDGAITGYDMVVRPLNVNPNFIAFGLLSHYILDLQLLPLTLRAAQPHLNREELNETIFIIPSKNEQNKIIVYIENESQKISNTISKIEQEIILLQEYRTSLINEAATGTICVV